MKKLLIPLAATLALTAAMSHAQTPVPAIPTMSTSDLMTNVPAGSKTVTAWYKQNIYDPSENKIGEVSDVLIDSAGKVTTLIVSVGGFLGVGEKNVAVSPAAVKMMTKDNAPHLAISTTRMR